MAVTGKPVAPVIAVFRADSKTLLAPSFLLSQDRENTFVHTSLLFSELEKREQALERLLPVIKVKTFQSTLRIQKVQLGALGYAAMRDFPLPQQNSPDGLRAVHFSGLS